MKILVETFNKPLDMYHSQWIEGFALRLIQAFKERFKDAIQTKDSNKIKQKLFLIRNFTQSDIYSHWLEIMKRFKKGVFRPTSHYLTQIKTIFNWSRVFYCYETIL